MTRRLRQRGLTLVELIVAFTIMSLLAGMAVPLARYRVRREKERELRYTLREIRTAIDKYKDMCDQGALGQKLGTDCYPETLESLVDGVTLANDASGKKVKFLRRIPRDPFTNSTDWGMFSTHDDPQAMAWGGQNVFYIYPKTMERTHDGIAYSDW
jgi:general secretion pathway protein G